MLARRRPPIPTCRRLVYRGARHTHSSSSQPDSGVAAVELRLGLLLVLLERGPRMASLASTLQGALSGLNQRYGDAADVVVRDSLALESEHYELVADGVVLGGGRVRVGHLLAVDTGEVIRRVPGLDAQTPSSARAAVWVRRAERDRATLAGYRVLEPAEAVASHCHELLRDHLEGRRRDQTLTLESMLDGLDEPRVHAPQLSDLHERLASLRSRSRTASTLGPPTEPT